MTYWSIPAIVAAEHQRSLIGAAEHHRLVAEAIAHRQEMGDGREVARRLARVRSVGLVRIRPIRATDGDLLREAFIRLSARSREQRFLGPKRSLSDAEVRYFTDVDHHDHEALVAVSRIDGRGLGVARYVRLRDDREVADVAVTIVDEWQLRGLGTALATRLAALAHCAGVRRFVALTSMNNTGARRLLDSFGDGVALVGRDGDTLTYEVALGGLVSERRLARRLMLGPVPADCASAR